MQTAVPEFFIQTGTNALLTRHVKKTAIGNVASA
jgi:hypothetical protein